MIVAAQSAAANNKQPFPVRAGWSDQSKAEGLNIMLHPPTREPALPPFRLPGVRQEKRLLPYPPKSIVYDRIEDRPAGTLDSPNVISAITAANANAKNDRDIDAAWRFNVDS